MQNGPTVKKIAERQFVYFVSQSESEWTNEHQLKNGLVL